MMYPIMVEVEWCMDEVIHQTGALDQTWVLRRMEALGGKLCRFYKYKKTCLTVYSLFLELLCYEIIAMNCAEW